jgi:outer membrane protein
MSARCDRQCNRASIITMVAAAAMTFFLAQPATLWARDLEDILTTPFVDPLHTRPGVLDSGVTLPGDTAPWQCRTDKDFSTPLALSEAIDLALCNNPQVKTAWAAIKVQAAAVGSADAAYLPTLSATDSRLRTGTVYPDSGISSSSVTGNTVYASLSWRLFDFGTRAANRQSANSLLVAALADHEASLQKTLAQTIQAYFDVQSARAAWQAKEQGEVIANDTLESAKRREANGVVARSDTLQAATALAKAVLDKNRALGSYRKNMSILIYAMGLPAESKVVLAEESEKDDLESRIGNPIAQQTEDLDAWLRDAQKSHPAILSARAQWQAAQSNIASARADGLPTIDFSGNNYQNGYPGQGLQAINSHINTIGISVTFPIFDGFSHTYKVRGAQAQAEQRKEQLADIEHNVLMEVVKAHADALSSLDNLQASQNLLEAAREALATSQRKYDKGATDILEILSTQGALADAMQERVQCLAEWRSARLRLMANTGLLGISSIR